MQAWREKWVFRGTGTKTFPQQSTRRKAGSKEQDKEGAATSQDSWRGPRVQRCSAGTPDEGAETWCRAEKAGRSSVPPQQRQSPKQLACGRRTTAVMGKAGPPEPVWASAEKGSHFQYCREKTVTDLVTSWTHGMGERTCSRWVSWRGRLFCSEQDGTIRQDLRLRPRLWEGTWCCIMHCSRKEYPNTQARN